MSETSIGISLEKEASKIDRAKRAGGRLIDMATASTEESPIPPHLQEMFAVREREITNLYSQVEYWHGRGKKANRKGEVVDVLDWMVEQGGFTPALDTFDYAVGPQHSLSLTEHRMYARAYADMNIFEGDEPEYEYLPNGYWFKRFIRSSINDPIAFINDASAHQGRKQISRLAGNTKARVSLGFRQNYQKWIEKVTLGDVPDNASIFTTRSNIPGNFPMLFGTEKGVVVPGPMGQILSRHETRSRKALPIEGLTHVEVPLNHVEEVEKQLLSKGVDLMVLPLELGEMNASKFTPDQLVHWNPFRSGTT